MQHCILFVTINDSYAVYGWDVICLISTLDAPQRCVWVNNFWVKEDFIFLTSIIRTLCSICPFRVRIKEVQLYWLTVSRLQCISKLYIFTDTSTGLYCFMLVETSIYHWSVSANLSNECSKQNSLTRIKFNCFTLGKNLLSMVHTLPNTLLMYACLVDAWPILIVLI